MGRVARRRDVVSSFFCQLLPISHVVCGMRASRANETHGRRRAETRGRRRMGRRRRRRLGRPVRDMRLGRWKKEPHSDEQRRRPSGLRGLFEWGARNDPVPRATPGGWRSCGSNLPPGCNARIVPGWNGGVSTWCCKKKIFFYQCSTQQKHVGVVGVGVPIGRHLSRVPRSAQVVGLVEAQGEKILLSEAQSAQIQAASLGPQDGEKRSGTLGRCMKKNPHGKKKNVADGGECV